MYVYDSPNGVKLIKSELLDDLPHGFATRLGGVSTQEHTASLNLRFGQNDPDEVILENLSRFCEAVGVSPRSTVSAKQIHSSIVRTVSRADCGNYYFGTVPPLEDCDGLVTRDSGVTLAVSSADCVPILLYDARNHVAAALHSGWRGTVAAIAWRGIEAMEALGAEMRYTVAAIGPCIHPCCFEVDERIREAAGACGEKYRQKFFFKNSSGALFADLPAFNRELLLDRGIREQNIEISELCTSCNNDLFYSYRVEGRARGSMISVISMK